MPGVARLGDVCSGHGCFPPRTNDQGSSTVFVNNLPAHRMGDHWVTHCCHPECHDGALASGDPTVFVNNIPLGRMGDPISCGSTVMSASSTVFSEGNSPPPIDSYSVEAVREIIAVAGQIAPFDEPVYTLQNAGVDTTSYPADTEPPAAPAPPTDLAEPEKEIPAEVPSCGEYTEVDYDIQLTQSFKLRDLSVGALFSHSIKSQCGFSGLEIICNLKALCENVLEPLNSAYPGFRINSGFRTATRCKSQHEKGQAADLQWPGLSSQEYLRRAEWIRDNLLFDQEIMEHGNSIWIHVSYAEAQRRQVLTMYRKNYESGLTLYYA